jgi:hypothetical protein
VKRGRKTKMLQPDMDVQGACESLREAVHDKPSGILLTVKVGGVVIGYRRQTHITFRRREVFIKVPGYKIEDVSRAERERILTAVLNVFIIAGASMPEITSPEHVHDTMIVRQDYVPDIPFERSPGLVSIAGGWGK